jgi:integrase
MSELLLDAAGRRRSPATLPDFHAGRPPRNKGMRYPADPPTIEEIVAVMRGAGDGIHGRRLRSLIVVLWRAGLRIHEALALAEADLDPRRGSLLVRRGKGGRRREVGMDDWAWEQLAPWLAARVELPVGPLFCVVNGPTRGRPWSAGAARSELRQVARRAGVRRRFAPHQLRHAHAVEMAREGVPLIVIQRQLGHTNLGITSIYLAEKQEPHSALLLIVPCERVLEASGDAHISHSSGMALWDCPTTPPEEPHRLAVAAPSRDRERCSNGSMHMAGPAG